MALAKSFRDLNVYQAAQNAAAAIFQLSKRFPRTEQYSLTDQIRRSSRAVNAMLAEAWARRRYRPAFVDKINQALGEAMETQSWLDHALQCEYLNQTEFSEHDQCWQKIGAMLARMIECADEFCKSPSTINHPRSTAGKPKTDGTDR
ncbi:MAG TPA: four helix bundle protein [Chthoniobacterales bacterium]|nr:four helix bundle protein [Chthoniobacterales bacterium]